ncbi:hypothetical protein SV13_01660 [Clostridium perfringens]|uniref:glycosyltransferase family 4 protein n=1 Tax=Clostridium perfringens TaxID=1502 RepID=UPI0013D3D8A7|nr:glycosyltransferase family 4 protein [Clostridium perfringens]KAF2785082.1 hypothetical protein SV13_01660 [Clostridium perfringens]
MDKEVKYIGFYELMDEQYKRNSCISATNKMNYIIKAINKTGRKVKVISPAWFIEKADRYAKEKEFTIDENNSLVLAPSFSTNNKITMKLKSWFSQLWLLKYLLINVKRGEKIIAYHSLALMWPIYFAKIIKGFELIYEVEEIYTDVINKCKFQKKVELKIISIADKYIFSTELLNNKVNINNKENIILYGIYETQEITKESFNDNKIHIVYAGTFDIRKGGVKLAIESSKYLDEKYHIHILGFGTEKDKKYVKSLIRNISSKTRCKITYEGLYKGNKFNDFIQKCNIGLSTQNSNAEFNDTSFPSKILTYLCNGLNVVSVKIKVLEKSKINDLLFYYENNDPREIANCIENVNCHSKYGIFNKINNLNDDFILNLKNVLEN